jgi:hypothetical protein
MINKSMARQRMQSLDYLRGFFILIIITDHLWRWPNIFQYVSGRGELWVSAAEGFVIISGLLVGYVRGRKGLNLPMSEISKKLIKRGAVLYIWAFITTVLLVAASWYLTFRSNIAFVPYTQSDWGGLLRDVLLLQYTHSLTHFLYLYAIFLILSPLFIWLLRIRLWHLAVAISFLGWFIGVVTSNEWLQWQVLFFIPAIVGFNLEPTLRWLRKIPPRITTLGALFGLSSILISGAIILPESPGAYSSEIFQRYPLSVARIVLAFVWFISLVWLFNRSEPIIEKSAGWLLGPFGQKSLTAYIVHSFVLTAIALVVLPTSGFILNSVVTMCAILLTLAIIKIPHINTIIPR